MDKLKTLYEKFYCISKTYLESETGQQTDDPEFDVDVSTLMSIVPVLEQKVCEISPSLTDAEVIKLMKYCNYQLFTFWFMRSNAVVKSVYNKLSECEKKDFICTFKEMLTVTQTLIMLNNMYNNIKHDTEDIVADSKKILEIITQIKSLSGEGRIYHLLNSHYSFIVRTVNKIFSDENYLLKLVAVFDSEMVNNKQKLEEYRQLLTISTESLKHGIKCISELTFSISVEPNKYTTFFRKVLSNIIIFQNNSDLNATKFITSVSKMYILVYSQLKGNDDVRILLSNVLESLKTKVSPEDIKSRGVRNIQSLIGYISDHKSVYKSILEQEYTTREDNIVNLLQQIVNNNNICYNSEVLNVCDLIKTAKESFFDKLSK
ncbi:virion morphogenesis core protein [Pteropox virus]|uniref:Virion morphogenesis core protein n=1 Tax=Pteropox virus TaxID=1873698 RepID=A0A1B1MRH8_9POXV|nr:virion morphogenesis core protein [Pteropox virus]ANS71184.1 virion morphogenesis core protein [Pteropox virus]